MKRTIVTLLSSIAFALGVSAAGADSLSTTILRPVTSTFMLKAGSSHRADTYLTPLKYDGWNAGFEYERFQAPRFSPDRWVMALNIGVDVDRTMNMVRNATMWGASLEGRWALWRRWNPVPRLTVGAGGSTTLNVGALYQARNGNNPVAAQASWTVDLSAMASWRFKIGKIQAVALYRASLPFIGAFFAPDYGQLYYEMYLGDTSGLVSAACWGRYFRFDQRLTVDLRLGGTTLRLGYSFEGGSTKVHSIVTQRVDHLAVIGVGGEWISLGSKKVTASDVRLIQTLY